MAAFLPHRGKSKESVTDVPTTGTEGQGQGLGSGPWQVKMRVDHARAPVPCILTPEKKAQEPQRLGRPTQVWRGLERQKNKPHPIVLKPAFETKT